MVEKVTSAKQVVVTREQLYPRAGGGGAQWPLFLQHETMTKIHSRKRLKMTR